MITPRYPIYVISKGRAGNQLTAKFLAQDGAAFHVVVEPQERDAYIAALGASRVLVLPFSNLGLGPTPARNWVWEHAKAAGYERHWILDDNIRCIRRAYKGRRIRCDAKVALAVVEDFTDRYENIALAGLDYTFFIIGHPKPFNLNCHVYSCLLIRNDLSIRWRGHINEDTDLCLQVLSSGLCTVLVSAFTIDKMATMTMKGGNTTGFYGGDGRLKMARHLERLWPGVVETKRRFNRPQHVVKGAWRYFDTPLKLKAGIDLSKIAPNDYGMKLRAVAPVKSAKLRALLKEEEEKC